MPIFPKIRPQNPLWYLAPSIPTVFDIHASCGKSRPDGDTPFTWFKSSRVGGYKHSFFPYDPFRSPTAPSRICQKWTCLFGLGPSNVELEKKKCLQGLKNMCHLMSMWFWPTSGTSKNNHNHLQWDRSRMQIFFIHKHFTTNKPTVPFNDHQHTVSVNIPIFVDNCLNCP